MPPIMIATDKYRKLPKGKEFPCSHSSAKALSALGMANYKTAEMPTELVLNKAEFFDVSVVAKPTPDCAVLGQTVSQLAPAFYPPGTTFEFSEEIAKEVADVDDQVKSDVAAAISQFNDAMGEKLLAGSVVVGDAFVDAVAKIEVAPEPEPIKDAPPPAPVVQETAPKEVVTKTTESKNGSKKSSKNSTKTKPE